MVELLKAVDRSPSPPGNINCATYLAAVDNISKVYDALFSIEMARRQLKSDIENSIDQIKERLLATRLDPRTTTLRELMENELKPEIYGPEKCRDRKARSAVIGLLWTNRAVGFVVVFMRGLHDGLSAKDASNMAYATLKQYHGWLTSKAVGTIMTAAPKRETILETMGIASEAQGKQLIGPLLELIEPLVADIIVMMDALGCNFADKV